MSFVINALTSQKTAGFVQNSACQVLSEGCLKAIGRPVFTLNDKTAKEEEKKYSASRELIYQSLSMISYFSMIFPIRKQSFKLLKHFPQFKNTPMSSVLTIEQFDNFIKNLTDKTLKTKIKGAREFISIIASGVILTIITPAIVNRIIHPIMEKLNIENKKTDCSKTA